MIILFTERHCYHQTIGILTLKSLLFTLGFFITSCLGSFTPSYACLTLVWQMVCKFAGISFPISLLILSGIFFSFVFLFNLFAITSSPPSSSSNTTACWPVSLVLWCCLPDLAFCPKTTYIPVSSHQFAVSSFCLFLLSSLSLFSSYYRPPPLLFPSQFVASSHVRYFSPSHCSIAACSSRTRTFWGSLLFLFFLFFFFFSSSSSLNYPTTVFLLPKSLQSSQLDRSCLP